MTEHLSTNAPLREFGSIQKPHTPENLEKARDTLTRAQGMDWKADEEPNCPHKTPCFPVADVEWLFAYTDKLLAVAERYEALRDRIRNASKHECSAAFFHELLDIAPTLNELFPQVHPKEETDAR